MNPRGTGRRGFDACGFTFERRKERPEGRAAVHFALDFNPTAMLFDNAEDSREAKAGSFADLFCRKERLEDAGYVLRADSAASVLHRKTHKTAWRDPGTSGDTRFIDSHRSLTADTAD